MERKQGIAQVSETIAANSYTAKIEIIIPSRQGSCGDNISLVEVRSKTRSASQSCLIISQPAFTQGDIAHQQFIPTAITSHKPNGSNPPHLSTPPCPPRRPTPPHHHGLTMHHHRLTMHRYKFQKILERKILNFQMKCVYCVRAEFKTLLKLFRDYIYLNMLLL